MPKHVRQEVLAFFVKNCKTSSVANTVLKPTALTLSNLFLHNGFPDTPSVPSLVAVARRDQFVGEFVLNITEEDIVVRNFFRISLRLF